MNYSKSDLLFLAVLATLPVQLGKFFWPNYSYVLGIPIDYRAITLYLSDLAVFSYLVTFAFDHWGSFLKIYQHKKFFIQVLVIFNLYLIFTSIFFSTSPQSSLWFSLKFFEFSLLAIFAAVTFSKKRVAGMASYIIIFSVLWQSALIILQFTLERSLGLWLLGERAFDSATVGIAHVQILGHQFLRPYGTFPHPNVAAAFLVISLIFLISSLKTTRQTVTKILTWASSTLAILLTFSQAALLAATIAAIFSSRSARHKLIASFLLLIIVGVFVKLMSDNQLASISERLTLAQAALDITAKQPLFGVGSANFIPELSRLDLFSLAEIRLLQPVHNVFLLILAENGILGLLLFTLLLFTVAKKINSKTKVALFIVILIFASFDHFLWTLQQGQMMFFLVLSYIVSKRA